MDETPTPSRRRRRGQLSVETPVRRSTRARFERIPDDDLHSSPRRLTIASSDGIEDFTSSPTNSNIVNSDPIEEFTETIPTCLIPPGAPAEEDIFLKTVKYVEADFRAALNRLIMLSPSVLLAETPTLSSRSLSPDFIITGAVFNDEPGVVLVPDSNPGSPLHQDSPLRQDSPLHQSSPYHASQDSPLLQGPFSHQNTPHQLNEDSSLSYHLVSPHTPGSPCHPGSPHGPGLPCSPHGPGLPNRPGSPHHPEATPAPIYSSHLVVEPNRHQASVLFGLRRDSHTIRRSFFETGLFVPPEPAFCVLFKEVMDRPYSQLSLLLSKWPNTERFLVATSRYPIDISSADYQHYTYAFSYIGHLHALRQAGNNTPIHPIPESDGRRDLCRRMGCDISDHIYVVYIEEDVEPPSESVPLPRTLLVNQPGDDSLLTDSDPDYLSSTYPEFTEILGVLKTSPHGKAYLHCLKYRIFTEVSHDLSLKKMAIEPDVVIRWMNEQPRTWRNIKARCQNASKALALIQGAELEHEHLTDRSVLQFFFESPLTMVFIGGLSSERGEWERYSMQLALKLPSTKLEQLTKRMLNANA